MYRWSKIPKKCRPEIISDISNNEKFYTFKVQDYLNNKVKRKNAWQGNVAQPTCAVFARWKSYIFNVNYSIFVPEIVAADECAYTHYKGVFKRIIDNNVPCIKLYKVKNEWKPTLNIVVLFLTGECDDIFLVHHNDLTKWDQNETV